MPALLKEREGILQRAFVNAKTKHEAGLIGIDEFSQVVADLVDAKIDSHVATEGIAESYNDSYKKSDSISDDTIQLRNEVEQLKERLDREVQTREEQVKSNVRKTSISYRNAGGLEDQRSPFRSWRRERAGCPRTVCESDRHYLRFDDVPSIEYRWQPLVSVVFRCRHIAEASRTERPVGEQFCLQDFRLFVRTSRRQTLSN